MDPLTASVVLGGLGTVGGLFTNQANRGESARNRAFQERMSSTAAQRSVADYRKAGLNPALAYDRPASSPGGSQAQMEDAVGKGISTGMQARMMREQLVNVRQDSELKQASAAKAGVEGANAQIMGDILQKDLLLKNQELAYRIAIQPHEVRAAALANIQSQYGLSKAEAESAYYRMMGWTGIGIEKLAGPAAGVAGGLAGGAMLLRRGMYGLSGSSARSITPLFKKPVPRRIGDWERLNRNRR